jgi:xanthosine utilization system XapX-like protein
MSVSIAICLLIVGGVVGMIIGKELADWNWRIKGDHEYMNIKASGLYLYTVNRVRDKPNTKEPTNE